MHDMLTPRRTVALIALAWLAGGMLLLLLTPLSGRSDALGGAMRWAGRRCSGCCWHP